MKLEDIKGPEDLKSMKLEELDMLSSAVREAIVETVSKNGGHLAPSLGVVELAIALHVAYESPRDRIIWDVSHQAYAHKILTGRAGQFKTLRQLGGISGFCKRSESPHDAFGAGHSSTSISAALGMAAAWLRTGEKRHAAAVIGDGALTGGMAFEALNHAGHLGNGLVVVLNDNEMSISPNVGAVAGYLTRIRSSSLYRHLRNDAEYLLSSIPAIGNRMVKATERVRHAFKHLLVPGLWFEELGFRYMGPVNGHDLSALIPVLREARNSGELVLLHVVTRKGHGYIPAEKNPSVYHGVGPFDRCTGEVSSTTKNDGKISFTNAFGRYITKLAEKDPRIMAVCAAMPEGTGLSKFSETYPERFFDVGICEQHAVTFAAGMACEGLRPIVAIYSTFMQRAYDQVIHDVCLQKLPVILALDRGGLVGEDGPTHHGVFDIPSYSTIPGLTLMIPRDANMLGRMMATAIRLDGPALLRYPRGLSPECELEDIPEPLPSLNPEVVREGSDGVIVALGPLVYDAKAVADRLSDEGIADLTVVDPVCVRPCNIEEYSGISGIEKILVTAEESQIRGGFGEYLISSLSENGIKPVTVNLGIKDNFVEWGPAGELRKMNKLDSDGLYSSISEILARNATSKT